MLETTLSMPSPANIHAAQPRALTALRFGGKIWFALAIFGQLIFASYIAGFFGRHALRGELDQWQKALPRGYVPGDTLGNWALSLHLLFAFMIILGGALQLLPFVRRAAPALHRWTGRLYLLATAVLSVSGLFMVWLRGTVGDLAQHIAISINALLILSCALLAWKAARARCFDRHQRWALRLFVSVSGVWFFRIGLMLWLIVNQGPVGFDVATFSGPFLTVLAFAVYVFVPITVLELFWRAKASPNPAWQWAMTSAMALVSLLTFAGTVAATLILWLPHLRA
jgi:uncharacterized membrane protein